MDEIEHPLWAGTRSYVAVHRLWSEIAPFYGFWEAPPEVIVAIEQMPSLLTFGEIRPRVPVEGCTQLTMPCACREDGKLKVVTQPAFEHYALRTQSSASSLASPE